MASEFIFMDSRRAPEEPALWRRNLEKDAPFEQHFYKFSLTQKENTIVSSGIILQAHFELYSKNYHKLCSVYEVFLSN